MDAGDLVYDGTTHEPIIGLNIEPELLLLCTTEARFQVHSSQTTTKPTKGALAVYECHWGVFVRIRFNPEEIESMKRQHD